MIGSKRSSNQLTKLISIELRLLSSPPVSEAAGARETLGLELIDLTDSPRPSSVPSTSTASPQSGGPQCPVCLDSFSAIKRRGQLVSTVCGHVFCRRCITACIFSQGQCPACRKRIGLKDFHPIYI